MKTWTECVNSSSKNKSNSTSIHTVTTHEAEGEKLVKDAIQSIISHYSQEIHNDHIHYLPSSSKVNHDDVPYFDPLLGNQNEHKVLIVNHWLNKFLNHTYNGGSSQSHNKDRDSGKDEVKAVKSPPAVGGKKSDCSIQNNLDLNSLDINFIKTHRTNTVVQFCTFIQTLKSLFESYHQQIRPTCFQFIQQDSLGSTRNRRTQLSSSSSYAIQKRFKACKINHYTHLILIHYEILLQRFINNEHVGQDEAFNPIEEKIQNIHEEEECMNILVSSIYTISQITEGLLHDILHLTCVERVSYFNDDMSSPDKSNNKSDNFKRRRTRYIIQNWILPTLLRVIQHTIHMLTFITKSMTIMKLEIKTMPIFHKVISNVKKCMSYDLIIATSFCSSSYKTLVDPNDETINNSHQQTSSISSTSTSAIKSNVYLSSDLNIFEILPKNWKNQMTLQYVMNTCAYSPLHDSRHSTITNLSSDMNKFLHSQGIVCSEKECTNIISQMNEPIINFDDGPSSLSSSCTFRMNWIDNIRGIGSRTAISLIHSLHGLATDLQHISGTTATTSQSCKYHVTNVQSDDSRSTLISSILDVLDTTELLHLVRANFFGRLNRPEAFKFTCDEKVKDEQNFFMKMNGDGVDKLAFNAITVSAQNEVNKDMNQPLLDDIDQIRIIKQISQKEDMDKKLLSGYKPLYREKPDVTSIDDQPFAQVQSRIVSSIRLLSSLVAHNSSSETVSNSLPIIYTLVDSTNTMYQSLGGALLIRLLGKHNSCSPSFVVVPSGDNTLNISKSKDSMLCFETAAKVLTMSIRACNDGVTLSILLAGTTQLFKIAEENRMVEASHLRIILTTNILEWISKHSYCGPSGESNAIRALTVNLTYGLNILLRQIAQQPNAAAVEIGRLGLSTILPLIRWDSSSVISRRIQFSALSCMISLMMGAYPIMKRHGGKIMAELVSCIGRGLRDIKIKEEMCKDVHGLSAQAAKETVDEIGAAKILVAFAIHTGSVALVLCGSHSEEVLLKLENGKYEPTVVNCCQRIRNGAVTLREARGEWK